MKLGMTWISQVWHLKSSSVRSRSQAETAVIPSDRSIENLEMDQ